MTSENYSSIDCLSNSLPMPIALEASICRKVPVMSAYFINSHGDKIL